MTVEKPKPKQLLRPITTGTNSAMNQSQFLAITCKSLEAREKSRLHGAIVLLLIGWKTGATLLSQSLNVAIAITSLLSTVIWKLLNCQNSLLCFKTACTFSVFMWRHDGHVGVQNNSEKSLLGFRFFYYAKLERHFVIVLYTSMAVSSREWKPRIPLTHRVRRAAL